MFSELAEGEREFFVSQSAFSAPNELAGHYADLPADPATLAGIVRNLLFHRLEEEIFGYRIPERWLHEDAETRYLDDILRIVLARDGRPLDRARELSGRFVGICRDFSLLYCSMLRHAGIPARVRNGFANYFGTDGFNFDHVVTEYWTEGHGWRLADAQLADPMVRAAYGIEFDPMDVPRDRMVLAGPAWRAIRAGTADPDTFGLPPEEGGLVGDWFVAGNVRLDLAALNGVEPLLWDIWGAETEHRVVDVELYDRAAEVVSHPVRLAAARLLFADDRLRMPGTVLTRPLYRPEREVTLR